MRTEETMYKRDCFAFSEKHYRKNTYFKCTALAVANCNKCRFYKKEGEVSVEQVIVYYFVQNKHMII